MTSKLSEFNRDALVIGFGTLISQLIPFLILPFLTRLYSKNDFGILTTYSTIITFFAIIINAKYESALLLPVDSLKASKIFDLTLFITLLIVIIVTFSVLILGWGDFFYDIIPKEYKFIYLLPLISLALGINSPATVICLRYNFFKHISINKIIRSIIISLVSIVIGYNGINAFGLVLGDVMGQLIAAIYLVTILSKKGLFNISTYLSLDLSEKKKIAKEYINFPKYSIPSALSENASSIITMLFLTSGFSVGVLGAYGFAIRVVLSPSTIIAKSVGDVFKQAASKAFATNGNCTYEYISTFKKLIVIASLPFPILILFAPWIFKKLFGTEWQQAGEFVQIMTPMFFLQFISNPLGSLFIIAQKQTLDFVLQLCLTISISIGLYLGVCFFESIDITLKILTFIYCIKYLIELYFSYQFAQNKKGL